jgi:predicted phage terminase large subunit-like protein
MSSPLEVHALQDVPQEVLDAILRSDFTTFVQKAFEIVAPGEELVLGPHHRVISHHVKLVLDGYIKRLIITVPPRSLKSIICSTALPAYALGLNPTAKIICASYSIELAGKLARDCRAVMDAPFYKRIFPATRLLRAVEHDLVTTRRGGRRATSLGGSLTGLGANLIVLDDMLKAADANSATARDSLWEWFVNTLLTRINDKKNGAIIVVMQRLHVDDLVGRLIRQGGWTHINMPAIAERDERWFMGHGKIFTRKPGQLLIPEHEPLEVLDRLKREMSPATFSAQYQQDPIPADGLMIDPKSFGRYTIRPQFQSGDEIYLSIDTAMKDGSTNDFSVCTVWHVRRGNYYLIDVFRARLTFPALATAAGQWIAKYPNYRGMIIEDKGAGTSLIQFLRETTHIRAIPFKPEGDKVSRALGQTPYIAAGHVLLPSEAPWLPEFLMEVKQFPQGLHDDQVDSMVQFLSHMEVRRQNRVIYCGPLIL